MKLHFYNNQKKQASSVAKSVNSLSNEIYKLNEKSQNLKTIIKNYEEIDKAIIKTKATYDFKYITNILIPRNVRWFIMIGNPAAACQ